MTEFALLILSFRIHSFDVNEKENFVIRCLSTFLRRPSGSGAQDGKERETPHLSTGELSSLLVVRGFVVLSSLH